MKPTGREFLDFAAQVLRLPPEGVSLALAYGDRPEWDSVMHLRLVMEFEAKYGIAIPIDKIPGLKTLADFYALFANAN